ncbi:tRNA ligase [Abortiporus biennis]
MASTSSSTTVDFHSKVNKEDSQLIHTLYKVSKQNPKLIRSSDYEAPADPSIHIKSWKMNEFKYYDVPSPFPTLARGLFTQEVPSPNGVEYRIVCRGYDKFFNIGEVPWNTWDSLEHHTKPPYVLTLKSNGCIIFIGALTPDKLLVTSKHSLGPIKGSDSESHAQVGERWLKTHLKSVGKTEEQLAAVLWEHNWTAVAELCDDSFEEHVLPYSSDKTGLHLHGLNECGKHFKTMLPPTVDAFAKDWGFIQTPSIVLNTIPEVRSFTDEIGKAGKWNGEALEGFVVRTHVAAEAPKKGTAVTPYEPGGSFFFKVKFDEPYMMYRDWREVTKVLLTKGPQLANVPKAKMRRAETKLYVKWVIDEIKRDRKPFEQYTKGKGIIATRERFLKWMGSEEGKKEIETADKNSVTHQDGSAKKDDKFAKTIIVPVAIPGVGKTAIAVALSHLFGFGHTQSDDIKAKRPAPIFIENVVKLLRTHDVVFADKNNHLRQHRRQLREAAQKNFKVPVRLMAFNWSFDLPPSTIHRICSDRVQLRGENHQSLQADDSKQYEDVLWQFIKNSEALTDDEVDVLVEMDVEESLDDALKRAVDACVDILGVERPSAEQMGEALAVARGYSPKKKGNKIAEDKKKKKAEPRYYALMPELDLNSKLSNIMKISGNGSVPKEGKTFWESLVGKQRLFDRVPHITIVHSKALDGGNQAVWDRCRDMNDMSSPPLFRFKLDRLLWDDKVMAIAISDLTVASDGKDDPQAEDRVKGLEFLSSLPEDIKGKLHITVGTADQHIPPVEARNLVGRWKEGARNVGEFAFDDLWVKGRVKGLFK